MPGGIPGEPAKLIGRGVAIFERSIPVSIFVRDHREQKDGGNQNECLELVQCPSREGRVLLRVEVTQFGHAWHLKWGGAVTDRATCIPELAGISTYAEAPLETM